MTHNNIGIVCSGRDNMTDACTHTRRVPAEWIEVSDDPHYDGVGGYWEEGHEVNTTVDIDLHRYKCTLCSKIMYYSNAARKHYEYGEDNVVAESIKRGRT